MDDRTREGLNFFVTAAVVLALVALLSTLMFPSWLHGSTLYVAVVVVAALWVAHELLTRDIIHAWGMEPLPSRGEQGPDGASVENDVEGATPKERVENRRAQNVENRQTRDAENRRPQE